jgi:phenylacetate-coenzyme A ligase PaaK-like adenylate-forming protein
VSASGESVTEADRETIGSAFGCGVLNGYGCTEHLMMGAQGPDERYMTLYDDDLIFEPFEDHTLVTNLFNETLPLIRYRMSDVLRPVHDPSASGPYLRIESLVGRTETPPKFLNEDGAEDFLSPHTINEIFVKGVTRFQMQLIDRESFRFLVCLDSTLTQDQRGSALGGVEKRVREILAQKAMRNVRFEVRVVDDLPVNPRTRKFQLIVAADAA